METRHVKLNYDYQSSGRRFNTRLHGTLSSESGPFVINLFEYGNGGRLLGRDWEAFKPEQSQCGQARSLYRHQRNYKWGHTIARDWPASYSTITDQVGSKGYGNHRRSTEAH